MRLTFDDDRAYEAFQFIWMGLSKHRLRLSAPQTLAHHLLFVKLAKISKAQPLGARVLIRECEVEITEAEQIHALDCLANTSWKPEVFKNVRRACEFLGAEFPSHLLEARS